MAFYHFLVLGEEKRQYYLAQMLKKEGHEVMEAMSYQPGYHDAILLPVPQTAMFFEENKEKFQDNKFPNSINVSKRIKQTTYHSFFIYSHPVWVIYPKPLPLHPQNPNKSD